MAKHLPAWPTARTAGSASKPLSAVPMLERPGSMPVMSASTSASRTGSRLEMQLVDQKLLPQRRQKRAEAHEIPLQELLLSPRCHPRP